MSSLKLLKVSGVSVDVAGKRLVHAAELSVSAGEVVSVIGPNGAGKTTLLRAIANDLQPASGVIELGGRAIAGIDARERARQVAVLTQHNSLEFAFTGLEVVSLARGPHSTGAALDLRICREAMEAMDVGHLAGRLYPTLSGGEQQRLQLARVLAQIWRAEDAGSLGQYRLLLLDEPATSLDIGHQHQLMRAVREFAATGVGVLMTVHDITLAASYSDRLALIKNGHCVAQGEPETVLTDTLVSDVFDTQVLIIPHPESGKPVVVGV
ncbi:MULTISPECIES: heme ABC transporter ATP-binding protein [unclassified Microbulbifer]|uniref:heme ABC transporter ATP-binding protein n=1 Tax=unclassified Microbulbifer TaxID=2619833 RepID=UPI0027E52645|nr:MULTISPECIES: heme ABC transporter ATP-binding protein [unclassified Microbulbifer]